MDHLIVPSKPTHPPTSVPYLCTTAHDKEMWITYYQRQGIQDADMMQPGFWTTRYGVLQNWLYFGPLWAFLGEAGAASTFLRKGAGGGLIIDTSRLPDYVEAWWMGLQLKLHEQRQQQTAEDGDLLHAQVEAWLQVWYEFYISIRCDDEIGQTVVFGIAVLHEAFCNAWSNIRRGYSLSLIVFRSPQYDDIVRFPWTRMEADGWCRRELETLKVLPPSLSYYASLVDRPGPGVDHTACSKTQCAQYKDPTTSHVRERCRCPLVAADTTLMSSILEEGSFPLIRMEKGKRGQPPTLKIVAHYPFMKFIAISHVWADGLGNQKDNSLPVCQLERLTKLADKICLTESMHDDDFGFQELIHNEYSALQGDSAKVYLWVDTICCPTASRHPEAHALSLNIMPKTYSEAENVLVLDKYIQSFPPTKKRFLRSPKSITVSAMERVIRIRCSRWAQRLWTLQEGALAERLLFQFADSLFDFDSLTTEVRALDWFSRERVPEEIRRFHLGVRCIRPPKVFRAMDVVSPAAVVQSFKTIRESQQRGSRSASTAIFQQVLSVMEEAEQCAEAAAITPESAYLRKFARVIEAVSTRSLTNPADEAVCLATLLDLDIEAIIRTPYEARMTKFWELQPFYSRSLIYFRGPRLQDPGMTWAPASLINRPNARDLPAGLSIYQEKSGKLTGDGLVMPFGGGVSSRPLRGPLTVNFFFREEGTEHIFFVRRKEEQEDNLRIWPPQQGKPSKIALIVLDDTVLASMGPAHRGTIRAELGIVLGESPDVIQVDLGLAVELEYCGIRPSVVESPEWKYTQKQARLGYQHRGLVDGFEVAIDGRWLSGNQMWGIRRTGIKVPCPN